MKMKNDGKQNQVFLRSFLSATFQYFSNKQTHKVTYMTGGRSLYNEAVHSKNSQITRRWEQKNIVFSRLNESRN